MKPFELLIQDSLALRQLLDTYMELRQHFQELNFKESDLDDPPTYTTKMMNLHDRFSGRFNTLHKLISDYGFEISRDELRDHIKPLLLKINELIPLDDGNT